jgi:hypothetical protein
MPFYSLSREEYITDIINFMTTYKLHDSKATEYVGDKILILISPIYFP